MVNRFSKHADKVTSAALYFCSRCLGSVVAQEGFDQSLRSARELERPSRRWFPFCGAVHPTSVLDEVRNCSVNQGDRLTQHGDRHGSS